MMTYYVRPRTWFDAAWIAGLSGGSRLPIDLHENADGFELTAAVPGLKAENIEIEVEDDVLTLRGKAPARENGQGEYLVREIGEPEFERRLRLPASVEAGKAEAVVADGVLTVRIPKAEEARPKLIPVRTR